MASVKDATTRSKPLHTLKLSLLLGWTQLFSLTLRAEMTVIKQLRCIVLTMWLVVFGTLNKFIATVACQ